MNVRKLIMLSVSLLLLTGCSGGKASETGASSTKKPVKTKETSEPAPSPTSSPLSTDHTILADKTLGIDYDFLEQIPLGETEARNYVENSSYAGNINRDYYSPDSYGFEVSVIDQNYSWLTENYAYELGTSDPYLSNSTGYVTVSITGEADYENSDGYYPDTAEALKKNLTDAGYTSQGDHIGTTDSTGYQINYYLYSKGKRTFSICEVMLNGQLSTCVLEVGDPA